MSDRIKGNSDSNGDNNKKEKFQFRDKLNPNNRFQPPRPFDPFKYLSKQRRKDAEQKIQDWEQKVEESRDTKIEARATTQYTKEEKKAALEANKKIGDDLNSPVDSIKNEAERQHNLDLDKILTERTDAVQRYYKRNANKRDKIRIQIIKSLEKDLPLITEINDRKDYITRRKRDLNSTTIDRKEQDKIKKDIKSYERLNIFARFELYSKGNWRDILEYRERWRDTRTKSAEKLLSKIDIKLLGNGPSTDFTEDMEKWSKALDKRYTEALKTRNENDLKFVREGLQTLKFYRKEYVEQKRLKVYEMQAQKEIEGLDSGLESYKNTNEAYRYHLIGDSEDLSDGYNALKSSEDKKRVKQDELEKQQKDLKIRLFDSKSRALKYKLHLEKLSTTYLQNDVDAIDVGDNWQTSRLYDRHTRSEIKAGKRSSAALDLSRRDLEPTTKLRIGWFRNRGTNTEKIVAEQVQKQVQEEMSRFMGHMAIGGASRSNVFDRGSDVDNDGKKPRRKTRRYKGARVDRSINTISKRDRDGKEIDTSRVARNRPLPNPPKLGPTSSSSSTEGQHANAEQPVGPEGLTVFDPSDPKGEEGWGDIDD